jgi:hypothetical protein
VAAGTTGRNARSLVGFDQGAARDNPCALRTTAANRDAAVFVDGLLRLVELRQHIDRQIHGG